MFVELGSSAEVWRAHIVRGILATYGIDAVLWHENASALYSQGWGERCLLLVWEDDVDDAVEILRSAPEAVPDSEPDVMSDDSVRGDIFPGIFPTMVAGWTLWAVLSLSELALHFVTSLLTRDPLHSEPDSMGILVGLIFRIPYLGLWWGGFTFLMLFALRVAPEFVKTVICILVICCLL